MLWVQSLVAFWNPPSGSKWRAGVQGEREKRKRKEDKKGGWQNATWHGEMRHQHMLHPSIRGGGERREATEGPGQVGMTTWYQCPFNWSLAGEIMPFRAQMPFWAMACGLLVPSKDDHNYHQEIYSCVKVCACSDIFLRRLVTDAEMLSRIDGTLSAIFLDKPFMINTTKAYHP